MSGIEPRSLWLGVAAALVVGCTRDTTRAPSTLVDGSPASRLPVVLEGVASPRVVTRVRIAPDSSPFGATGVALCASVKTSPDPIVQRTGVSGASVTFFDSGRRSVHACDATDLDRSGAKRWCAHAFGRLSRTRLRDPRLSITCRDADGDPVGFAWVQPSEGAAYVAVRQPGYAELYAVVATAPVRVTTSDVDLAASAATFSISEHARDGTRIRSYDLEAQVAG